MNNYYHVCIRDRWRRRN